MTVLTALFEHDRTTTALSQVMMRLGWDQETMMPAGSADQRAEEIAALETVLHARRQDPRIGDWIGAATPETDADRARLRLLKRDYERALRIPGDLAAELARLSSKGQGIWVGARKDEDVAAFLPALSEIVARRREAAAALADGGDLYDALMDDYEPGLTGAEIAAMFDRMRVRLVDLRGRIMAVDATAPVMSSQFPHDAQLGLARRVAEAFGYDFNTGRLDLAVHPFSSGSGADVRITTRVDESDPFNCLYSTIHEVGHAAYEQHVDPAHRLTRLGQGVSMGVHESQSRIFENQLGRSRAFCGWLHGAMSETFDGFEPRDAEGFYRAVNQVRSGFIRTEADEVHYNLHIMLRFDLERALIRGEIEVADLEAAWNERFEADFGAAVDKPSNGVLQDVHWAAGLFGYFPTYSLGNVYAGCLHAALRADLPDLDAQMAAGELGGATTWLAEKVQQHGSVLEPRAVIEAATGGPVSEEPLLDYLDEKFEALYQL